LGGVEDWVKRDHEGDWKIWLSWLNTISRKVSSIDGVETSIIEPEGLSNKSPVLRVSWDPGKLHVSGFDIAEELGRNKPRIALAGRDDNNVVSTVILTTGHIQAGEEKISADRLYGALSRKRCPKAEMAAPAANLADLWDVIVRLCSSTSHYSFTITQD